MNTKMDTKIDIEEIVRQNPHVVSITYTVIPLLPDLETEIEYGLFPTLPKERVKDFMRVIYHYLTAPIIQDDFEHHSERRVWVKGMEERYGQSFLDYIHQNKLRGNALTPVYGYSSFLESCYTGSNSTEFKQAVETLFDLARKVTDEQIAIDQRVRLLQNIDTMLMKYISFLTKNKGGRV